MVVGAEVIQMSDTFHLHNRGTGEASSISTSRLEESARDRKNQLESVILQLRKIATHLHIITDEKVTNDDIVED